MELYETLEKYYNFKEFKPLQKQLILKLLAKKDVLAVLPTGYGKSLIYQMAGLMLKGITIVITPLISLMKDQVDNLEAKGIRACYINSLVSKPEQEKIYANILSYKFIYVSPERLNNPSFYSKITNVSLVVMDEAHTMLWGLEFRKAMLDIKGFIKSLKNRPVIAAFTATANGDTISFIIKSLGLKRPFLLKRLPVNDNNKVTCIRGDSKAILERLLEKNREGRTIIYAITRRRVMDIYDTYRNSYNITYYHGDLEREEKMKNQEMFARGNKSIIVATVAFGMGIDIKDIRTIILYDLPLTLADLIQEIGRAGRDGKPCNSFIILSREGLKLADGLIKQSSNVSKAELEFDQVIRYFYSRKKKKFLEKYFNS